MFTLQYKKRTTDKLPKLRKNGFIPAVFYGPKEVSTPVSIKEVEFHKVWREAGESSIIT
jgi:ribosomal protein L25 (general stress protein Ctc)